MANQCTGCKKVTKDGNSLYCGALLHCKRGLVSTKIVLWLNKTRFTKENGVSRVVYG